MVSSPRPRSLLLLLLFVLCPAAGRAQDGGRAPVHAEVFAGSELESYLRTLQVAGRVPVYPWSVRGFSQRELSRLAPDSIHPWAARYDLEPPDEQISFSVVQPRVDMDFNSAFPYGINDGPRWRGRGLTTAARFGFAGRMGPVSVSVVPEAFIAQNAQFEIRDNGREGHAAFGDARLPLWIDLPQRFGDAAYGRIDPGESSIRLDLPVVSAGLSTGSQFWGPAASHPVLLGNNAGGFPHAFLGTSEPLNVWLGHVHGRLVWGDLRQTPYTEYPGTQGRRFMSGLVGVFVPRGLPGLELGAGRFFHSPWPEGGLTSDHFRKPLQGLLKANLNTGRPDNNDRDNQIASVFGRWVFPAAGLELYGEFGREDHSWDSRDLLLEPDHISAYMIGLRRVWDGGGAEMVAMRAELINSGVSHLHITRDQPTFYTHSTMRQGHTHRGQILGSAAAFGGGGGVVAVDRFHERGRWTLAGSRLVRYDQPAGATESAGQDVLYGVDAEALLFLRRFDLTARLSAVQNLNRDFARDRFNLGASVGLQWRP